MNIQTAKEIIEASVYADDSVLMKGPHGIGKSNIVKQFAKENGYHLEELFLSHQEVGDVIGIPHMIEKDGEQITTWSKPIWLKRMYEAAERGTPSVLFLDELNRAPIDVRQTALQLVLEKTIHEHKLPEVNGQKTIIVSAINPADDYQVDELDPALLSRFLTIEVEPDPKAWLKWAKVNDIDKYVYEFIVNHPNRLWYQPNEGRGSDPRALEKLSMFMKNKHHIKDEILYEIIAGKIGPEVGSQFYMFYREYSNIINENDIDNIILNNDCDNIEEYAALIKEKIHDMESILKTELSEKLSKLFSEKEQYLSYLAYLYALPVEVCLPHLKQIKEDDYDLYKKIVDYDTTVNNKKLFINFRKNSQV